MSIFTILCMAFLTGCFCGIKFELIKALLTKAIEADKLNKQQLLYLSRTSQYHNLVKYLVERANRKPLNKIENYVLLIAGTIEKILQTKTIPEVTTEISYDMYYALLGNNYELALEINNTHHNVLGTSKEDDVINILLIKIMEIINELKPKHNLTEKISETESAEEKDCNTV